MADIDDNTDASEIGRVLKEMTYLDAVIKETLRCNPPVQFIFRTNDMAVKLGGYDIPPKTHVRLKFCKIINNTYSIVV